MSENLSDAQFLSEFMDMDHESPPPAAGSSKRKAPTIETVIKKMKFIEDQLAKHHSKLEESVTSVQSQLTEKINNVIEKLEDMATKSGTKRLLECLLCFGEHDVNECTTFPTAETRKKFVLKSRKCPTCLTFHRGECSRKDIDCLKCKQKGHCKAICTDTEA